jgi:hypothetical protein
MRKQGKIGQLSVKDQRYGAAGSVPEYIGHWLECSNRKCGFPVRVPYAPAAPRHSAPRREAASLLFACPICLQVNYYSSNHLRDVQFRSPDPYKTGKLVLYSALVGCARPRCQSQAIILTAAAANVSLALLLRLWKSWKVDFSCKSNHRFRPRHPHTWWIEEKDTLTWPGA